ncbi:hypothetical protein [Streptomyces regalis]|nr:hypothetical protein [Streptomyces regalis]
MRDRRDQRDQRGYGKLPPLRQATVLWSTTTGSVTVRVDEHSCMSDPLV